MSKHEMTKLEWKKVDFYEEATLGDFAGGDGVRFTLCFHLTCYRRGPWRLLIEVAPGPGHHKWGCFDEADQPERYYHLEENAHTEARAIAAVLVSDRTGPCTRCGMTLMQVEAADDTYCNGYLYGPGHLEEYKPHPRGKDQSGQHHFERKS